MKALLVTFSRLSQNNCFSNLANCGFTKVPEGIDQMDDLSLWCAYNVPMLAYNVKHSDLSGNPFKVMALKVNNTEKFESLFVLC